MSKLQTYIKYFMPLRKKRGQCTMCMTQNIFLTKMDSFMIAHKINICIIILRNLWSNFNQRENMLQSYTKKSQR